MAVFTLNGIEYNLNVMKLTRKAAVTDTDKSGRVISGAMFRDIIGTFYNYTLDLEPKNNDMASYNAFYDVITDPGRDSHTLVVPYGQDTLEFQAYVTSAEDTLHIKNGVNLWGLDGLKLDFIAMEPQRR